MKTIATLLLFLAAGTLAMAHGNNDHVRGTVTQVSAQAITVQTTANTTKTLTLSEKTTFTKGGQKAALADLKIGDRVVVDVPKNSNEAASIQFGTAAPKAAAHTGHEAVKK